ncbi:MAG: hypothetical protein ACJA2S_000003 [Cyclobacteriaceae bacterium]
MVRAVNANNSLADQSDGVFEIIDQKSVKLLDPNGGELYDQNRNFNIQFSSIGLADDVGLVIEYSENGGLLWEELTSGTVASFSGNFNWFSDETIFTAGNIYLMRVRTADNSYSDESNNLFSVISPVATSASFVGSFSFNTNWNEYPNATSYSLNVSESVSFDSFIVENLLTTNLTETVSDLYHNVKYYFRVKANIESDYTSPSSNVIKVRLPESSDLKADSLALVPIHTTTDGNSWTNNDGWLVEEVRDWHGVTFENGRITGLDLSNNNLTGSFPELAVELDHLINVNLSGNTLVGVPDFSNHCYQW